MCVGLPWPARRCKAPSAARLAPAPCVPARGLCGHRAHKTNQSPPFKSTRVLRQSVQSKRFVSDYDINWRGGAQGLLQGLQSRRQSRPLGAVERRLAGARQNSPGERPRRPPLQLPPLSPAPALAGARPAGFSGQLAGAQQRRQNLVHNAPRGGMADFYTLGAGSCYTCDRSLTRRRILPMKHHSTPPPRIFHLGAIPDGGVVRQTTVAPAAADGPGQPGGCECHQGHYL